MRYLMMDTNIFIDMIIDRKHNVSEKLVESFIKLLDFDEIRLVIPAIVVYETNKHIEEQLEEVGKKIKSAIKSLDDIYGINGYEIAGLEIKEYKRNSSKELKELFKEYENRKNEYLQEIKAIVKKIFEHNNCKIFDDTEYLRSACLQRRIYKRAPFHHEKKESYADGLITESLIHISTNITLEEEDDIIFVTGNTSDFSNPISKRELHQDICEDLQKAGIDKKVKYIISFSELIGKELKQEVSNANLKEEFEKELEQELKEAKLEEFRAVTEERERESAGLTPLDSFEDKFLQDFCESDFAEQLKEQFEKINKCFSELEKIASFYEELSNDIDEIEEESFANFQQEWNARILNLEDVPGLNDILDIEGILSWLNQKVMDNDYSDVDMCLPDCIEYGESIIIYGMGKEKYELSMDQLCLNCENGGSDWLDIGLYKEKEKCASGYIEISYGFVEMDDDGVIGDAGSEKISYHKDEIISCINTIIKEYQEYIAVEKYIIEEIDIFYKYIA